MYYVVMLLILSAPLFEIELIYLIKVLVSYGTPCTLGSPGTNSPEGTLKLSPGFHIKNHTCLSQRERPK